VLDRGRAGQTYHINGDAELTNTELTAALLQCCGAGWDMVTRVPDRKGHDRRYSLNDDALRALGYAPQIPFHQGLQATVRWYQANRTRWEPLMRGAAPALLPLLLRSPRGRRDPVAGYEVGGMLGTDLVAALTVRGEPVTGGGPGRAGRD
jgi:hypothetical protein